MRLRLEKLQEVKHQLIGRKNKNVFLKFMESIFDYKKKVPFSFSEKQNILNTSNNDNDAESENENTGQLLSKILNRETKLSVVCDALAEENCQRVELQSEMKFLKKEHTKLTSQLQTKVEKLAKLTPRNVSKRVNRQKENNKILHEKVKEANLKLECLMAENKELNENLDKALSTTLKLRKQNSNLKVKNKKINETFQSQSYIQPHPSHKIPFMALPFNLSIII